MRGAVSHFHSVLAALCTATVTICQIPQPALAENPAEMDALFAELAQPQGDGWQQTQSEIERIWSQSGSAALDLLLIRGEAALDAGQPGIAVGHLTALTDHAPEFAAGWAARASALWAAGQAGPAGADLARALALEPRHWPALTQLASMLEALGNRDGAAEALRRSLAINPHQQDARDALDRLTRDPDQEL